MFCRTNTAKNMNQRRNIIYEYNNFTDSDNFSQMEVIIAQRSSMRHLSNDSIAVQNTEQVSSSGNTSAFY
jgi:hypothetical protein